MSLRIAIVCSSLLFAACGGDTSLGDASNETGVATAAQALQFTNSSSMSSLPNTMLSLTVQYHDLFGGNVQGVAVDFALTGSAPGASLTPARATTDANGLATTSLRVGATTGDIEVRARTATGLTAYTQVTVGEALGTELAVTLQYEGARPVATYTVTSLPMMSCPDALDSDLAGDVSYTFDVSAKKTVTFDFGSGLGAAIVGFGRDASGAPLAVGCQEFKADITSAPEKSTLVLKLENQALAFDDALPIDVQVTLQSAATRLGDTAEAAVSAIVPATDAVAAANYYLDAVVASLNLTSAAQANALTERRTDGSLAASLSAFLGKQNIGPNTLATQAASLLRDRAAQLSVSSSY